MPGSSSGLIRQSQTPEIPRRHHKTLPTRMARTQIRVALCLRLPIRSIASRARELLRCQIQRLMPRPRLGLPTRRRERVCLVGRTNLGRASVVLETSSRVPRKRTRWRGKAIIHRSLRHRPPRKHTKTRSYRRREWDMRPKSGLRMAMIDLSRRWRTIAFSGFYFMIWSKHKRWAR
jgi:hypothetical protein